VTRVDIHNNDSIFIYIKSRDSILNIETRLQAGRPTKNCLVPGREVIFCSLELSLWTLRSN